jgi:hypothetical protein
MIQHLILNLNPSAKFEWERCTLHHPITAQQPSLPEMIAGAIDAEPGSYLVSVSVEVKVLERAAMDQVPARFISKLDLPQLPVLTPEFIPEFAA